jgi:hypothetical protein
MGKGREMDRSERLRHWHALLRAKVDGDKAAEAVARAALAPAMAEFRARSHEEVSARIEALANAVAMASANDNG